MSSYEELYKSVCRICLGFGKSEKMLPLIDNSTIDGLSSYAKAVITLTNIVIQNQDGLPEFMCINCLSLLKGAIYFKFKCEASEKKLKQFACNSVNKNSMKEKVVEYAMYKLYLPDKFHNITKEDRTQTQEQYVAKSKAISENHIQNTFENDPMSTYESDDMNNSDNEYMLDKMQNVYGTNCDLNSVEIVKKPLKRQRLKMLRKRKEKRKKLILERTKKFKDNQLICKVCDKVLANHLTYEHHMQRHNGCRYICEHCGKGFPVLTELQIHQVSQHGTGPYLQCSHCSFKAPRKFDLIEHERIHSGERPYACDKCGLTFRRRGIWRKHLIYHTEKRIQCPHCPRKFFQRSEMLAHANNIHDRVYVYLCGKCGVTYAKTATVRRHMTERHGIPREMQGKILRINKSSSYHE